MSIRRQFPIRNQTLLNLVRKQLPPKNEINLVLGIVIFVVHTWSIKNFLYKIPSFLLYTSPTDIFAILCYMMAFALLESLVVITGMVVLSTILPHPWLRDGFAYKGFVIVSVFTIASIWLQRTIGGEFPAKTFFWVLGLIILSTVTVLCFLMSKLPLLQKIALEIEERINIMLYIYVPLGLIGIVVIIIRNIF